MPIVIIAPHQINKQVFCSFNSTLYTKAHVTILCLFAMSVTWFSGWGCLTLSRSPWGHCFGILLHSWAAVHGPNILWSTPPPSKDPL